MSKYKKLDARVFKWLSKHRSDVTTTKVFKALRITDLVAQRHISRRFTQLEDRGVLSCTLKRTMRVCSVVKEVPKTLAKKKWAPRPQAAPPPPIQSIPANDSLEFEQAGGRIEKLPTHWDKPCSQNPLGAFTFTDYINELE